jgi:putative endonuclease
MKQYYVYILTSQRLGTLYIGVTSDLKKRVWEHKNKIAEGFTKKYSVDRLVHYEVYDDPENAILREKQMKKWNREWKINLIQEKNKEWNDLYDEICR